MSKANTPDVTRMPHAEGGESNQSGFLCHTAAKGLREMSFVDRFVDVTVYKQDSACAAAQSAGRNVNCYAEQHVSVPFWAAERKINSKEQTVACTARGAQ